jgi:hypothetical protein
MSRPVQVTNPVPGGPAEKVHGVPSAFALPNVSAVVSIVSRTVTFDTESGPLLVTLIVYCSAVPFVFDTGFGAPIFVIVRSVTGVAVRVGVFVNTVADGVLVSDGVNVTCVQPRITVLSVDVLFPKWPSGIVWFGFTVAVFVIGEFT